MVSFKIAVASAEDKDILTKPKTWDEKLTADHADRMFRDEDIRDLAKKRWNTHFQGLHWGHVTNFQKWGQGYSFTFLGHKLTHKTVKTAKGSKVEFDVEAHLCFVMIQMIDDTLVVYLAGPSSHLDTARVRLAQYLNPQRKRGWLRVLTLQPEELAKVRESDLESAEDIRAMGFKKGDGFNDVTIAGIEVHRSSIEQALVNTDLNQFKYGSRWLTKHLKAKELVVVNLSKSGSISAACPHEDLDRFVLKIIIPIVKESRGKIVLA